MSIKAQQSVQKYMTTRPEACVTMNAWLPDIDLAHDFITSVQQGNMLLPPDCSWTPHAVHIRIAF